MGNETKAIGAGPTDGSTQRWPHLGRRLTAPRQRRTWSSRLGGSVRKVLVVGLAVPMLLAVGVGPVLADTTGGNGTQFNSFTSSCAQSGTRQVCTDTQIGTFTDDTGEAQLCVDVFTYSISGRGSFTFIADQFGCTSEFSQTIGSDYSVTIEPTTVSLATCKAHQRQCSGSTEVTVSASDTTVNDVSTTTTKSTTKSGDCTTKTTTDETAVSLTGTMTIGSTTYDEDGFLDIFSSTSTTRCR